MNEKLSIIIPCYNEENSLRNFLPEVIKFCRKHHFRLILVDDGSTDNTQALLKEYSPHDFTLIKNKVNRGYGGAIKAGIAATDNIYIITIDADGQHYLEDVEKLYNEIISKDADMIVGRRNYAGGQSYYRGAGKWLIRKIAKLLLPLNIHDINSGMKIYNTSLAKKYLHLCPDTMAYSDIIAMVFISQKHLVLETDIKVKPRASGKSAVNTMTAFETIREILNIVVLFNPMRIFLPISLVSILASLCWGIPIILKGRGVSVGAMLGITTGLIFFFLGLLAEQLSLIRKGNIKDSNN